MNEKERRNFRQTVAWKRFREQLIKARGARCELFGTKVPAKRLDLHHVDPANYDNLDPAMFKLLSSTAHDIVEFMAVKLAAKVPPPNADKWRELLDGFLPISKSP